MNYSSLISSQNLSQPHKLSKHFFRFNNLDPVSFTKTRPKIIHNLGISQPALQSISPQNIKKLIQSLKNIKFLHNLKLRLGKCNPEDLKKIINQLKAFKGIKGLKLDLFGFQREGLKVLMTLPRKIARGHNLTELEVDFSTSSIPPYLMSRLLSGFLKSQSCLTSLHSKFETLDFFQEKDLVLLSESLQERASLLKDLKLDFNECYDVSGKGLYELMIRGFSRLPDLKRLSLNLKDCRPTKFLPSENYGFGCPNLLKTKNLVCLDLNFHRFEGLSTKDVELLAMQFKDSWSFSLKNLTVKFPSMEAKDFEIFTDGLGSLKSLRKLKFTMNTQESFPHEMIQSLTKGLIALEVLEDLSLKLKDMKLQNKDVEVLSKAIKMRKSLKYLKLSLPKNFEITKEGLDEIFDGLKESKALEGLDLNLKGCKVTGSNINKLAARIEDLKELRVLKLCLNNLEDKGSDLSCLSASLGNLLHLRVLKFKLHRVGITGQNLMEISQNLKKTNSIKKLTLYLDNDGTNEILWRQGYETLFSGLKEILTLTDLSVQIERTGDDDIWVFFQQLKGWNNLTSLFLGFHSDDIIDEESAEDFYQAMKTLGGLKNFTMHFYWATHIQPEIVFRLLKGVGELNNVENLEFDLVNTAIGFLAARGPEYNLSEVERKLLEKLVNMKSLKKCYFMKNQIV